jgi:hypothetical protein
MFKGFLFFWVSWYAIRYAILVWLGLIGIGIVWTVAGRLCASRGVLQKSAPTILPVLSVAPDDLAAKATWMPSITALCLPDMQAEF